MAIRCNIDFVVILFFLLKFLCSCDKISSGKDDSKSNFFIRNKNLISVEFEYSPTEKGVYISITNHSKYQLYLSDVRPLTTHIRFYGENNEELDYDWILNNIHFESKDEGRTFALVDELSMDSLNVFFDNFFKENKMNEFIRANFIGYRKLSQVSFLFLKNNETYKEFINLTPLLNLKRFRLQFEYLPHELSRVKLMDSVGVILPEKLNNHYLFDMKIEGSFKHERQ